LHIYKAEKEAGLEDLVKASIATTLTKKFKPKKDSSLDQIIASFESGVQSVEDLIGTEQPDLAVIVSILVSAGWNLNDDVFIPAELWASKHTPNHKPMNDQHNETDILGHIISSRAIDKMGNEIFLDEEQDPPEEFDIEVAGVLYKALPSLANKIQEIMRKAAAGNMFVSMEAWFTDFAYGFLDSMNGQTKVVSRSEDTAFLTKHLRMFGGTGEFQGHRIGRVLKNITFGGQAFVDVPANPESVIKVAAFKDSILDEISEGGVNNMDWEKQAQELQTKLDEVNATVEAKDEEIAKISNELSEAKDANSNIANQLGAKQEEFEVLAGSTSDAVDQVKTLESEKKELQKNLDAMTKKSEEANAELEEIRKAEQARERFVKLSSVKEIKDEEKDDVLAELKTMQDDTFDLILKYAGNVKAEEEEKEECDADHDHKDDEDCEHADEDKTEAALDSVEDKEDPDLQAGNEDAGRSLMSAAQATANRLMRVTDEGGD